MVKNAIFRILILLISLVPLFIFSCQSNENEGLEQNEIHLLLNRHPFTESILRFLPEFEKQTNIKVHTLLLSEEEYFKKLITELSSCTGYYDVFMVGFPHIWRTTEFARRVT